MKYIRNYLLLLLILGSSACTDEFSEINTNPNAPIDVEASLLLRHVLFDYAEQMSYEGFVAGNLLGQYFTAIDFNLFDRHSLAETQFGGNPWPILYTNLRDNEIMLEKARTSTTAEVYEGPALILKAYMTAALTDMYGNVPYSESLEGKSGNVNPVYDDQAEIYTGEGGILDNLEKAVLALSSYDGSINLEGDLLFGGDLEAWIRFANSLRIKYLMRISGREDVGARLQQIFQEGQYLQSHEQNASFDFTNTEPNNFRLATARIGDFNLFIMSETIEEILQDLNDPRIAVFFRPTSNDPRVYKGLLNGPDASQTSISVADFSLSGSIFRERTGDLDANYMTAWETHFFLAEAAERGLIDADAQALYEEGVRLAFEYWQTELPADYLTTGPAAYGQDPLEQILTQKWLANIINGYEGWIEYRRTGFPRLKTIAASLNDDLIPVRLPYPTDEAALNAENFEAAATATEGNSINSRVWWDVE